MFWFLGVFHGVLWGALGVPWVVLGESLGFLGKAGGGNGETPLMPVEPYSSGRGKGCYTPGGSSGFLGKAGGLWEVYQIHAYLIRLPWGLPGGSLGVQFHTLT